MIRPMVSGLTQSQIHCLVTVGLATIDGGTLAAFINMGVCTILKVGSKTTPCVIFEAILYKLPSRKQSFAILHMYTYIAKLLSICRCIHALWGRYYEVSGEKHFSNFLCVHLYILVLDSC